MDINRHLKDHAWDLVPISEVENVVPTIRQGWGFEPVMASLLTMPDGTYKFRKGTVPICGVSMLPHTLSEHPDITMCANSTPECRQYCILYSGRGATNYVYNGRGWKTDLLIEHPNVWFTMLHREVTAASKKWPELRCRLNIFSDVHFEKLFPEWFWQEFSKVRFQDYTKNWRRLELPRNYRLVYSASERTTIEKMQQMTAQGHRVTVVFDVHKSKPLPKRWEGMRVVDGDVDDDLWSRPKGAIIGLRAKGRLRAADSPFKRKVA